MITDFIIEKLPENDGVLFTLYLLVQPIYIYNIPSYVLFCVIPLFNK